MLTSAKQREEFTRVFIWGPGTEGLDEHLRGWKYKTNEADYDLVNINAFDIRHNFDQA